MPDVPTTRTFHLDDRFAAAVADFEMARDAGKSPDPNVWLADHPELADRLAEYFATQKQLHDLAAPAGADSLSEEAPEIRDYQVLEQIGRGGMGTVYKAYQHSAKRTVALKVISAGRLEGLEPEARRKLVERFITEGQAAAQLDNEHIVKVYEVGECGGRPFYSMRLVDGKSLSEMVQAGPLDPRRAARYVEQAARAMHDAHQHGILHRDLKPHNILVEAKGDRPMIADFGLAKLARADCLLTSTRTIMGTPPYMPPEQAVSSAQVTVASDVYSLGATLYELLTGRAPFEGKNPVAILKKVLEEEPVAPRKLNPAIPRDLEVICLKCLEKQPAKRYTSSLELADRLRLFLEGKPIPDRPVSSFERLVRWCRRRPAAAAMIGTILSLTLVIVIGSPIAIVLLNKRRERAVNAEVDVKKKHADLSIANTELGKKHAELTQRLKQVEMGKYGMQIGHAYQLLQAGHVFRAQAALNECPVELRDFEHRLVSSTCHRRARVLHDALAGDVVFSPDGKMIVAMTEAREVSVRDTSTGKVIRAFPFPIIEDEHEVSDYVVEFSRDSRALVVVDGHAGELKVWDIATGDLRTQKKAPKFAGADGIRNAVLSPDLKWLAVLESDEKMRALMIWDIANEKTFTTLVAGKLDLVRRKPVVFSPNGQYLAYPYENGTIAVIETNEYKTQRLLKGVAAAWPLGFSPDSKKLLSTRYFQSRNESDVEIWDIDTSALNRTFKAKSVFLGGAFSPDGREIAIAEMSIRSGPIRFLDADTGQERHSIRCGAELVLKLAYSPDGEWLAVAGGEMGFIQTAGSVILARTNPKDKLVLAHKECRSSEHPMPAVSRDGRFLATRSQDEIKIWTLSDGKLVATVSAEGTVEDLAFTDSGEQIISAAIAMRQEPAGDVEVRKSARFAVVATWDARTGKQVSQKAWKVGDGWISLSANGGYLLWCANGGTKPKVTSILWNASTGNVECELDGQFRYATWTSPYMRTIHSISPTNSKQIALRSENSLIVRDVESGTTVTRKVDSAFGTLIGNGLTLAIAGERLIHICEAETGELRHAIRPSRKIKGSAVDHRGKRLATCDDEGIVTLWDIPTGQQVLEFSISDGSRYPSSAIAFTPDGERLIVAHRDRVEVWTTEPPGEWVTTGKQNE